MNALPQKRRQGIRQRRPLIVISFFLAGLLLQENHLGQSWGQIPPPARRPLPNAAGKPTVSPPPSVITSTDASPTAISGVSLRNNVLSIMVQNQEVRALIQQITTQGQIDVLHMESLPDRRISLHFEALPLIEGLTRLLRVAEVSGYVLVTGQEKGRVKVQRLIFLSPDTGSESSRRPTRAAAPPALRQAPPPPPAQPPPPQENRDSSTTPAATATTVFEDLRTNATARRLLNQVMHPNEQVRERALESLVRLMHDDRKQRDLLEFIEPLMEDLGAEDKETQENAREEIRQLLRPESR